MIDLATTIKDLCTVPVIFANKRDNDLPGFIAALENRRVAIDGRIYEPGETIDFSGLTMAFACGRIMIIKGGWSFVLAPPGIAGAFLGATIIIKAPVDGREVVTKEGTVRFGLKVTPC
ncbi:hypothetical protein LH464_04320 [Neorhizobium sp. T786]|uniref:hypothetical protein n=1 Tax=Pseudorhizobium xiangyangii TaxID=2883104 RepID=UPI001CFFC52E|nr:hypothetical protein [Neorhizobium xiangyangii]MCB5201703.1 hypothetical protein [Neorhizobium xiangyangii]